MDSIFSGGPYNGPERRKSKPLGLEKMLMIGATILCPAFGAIWYSVDGHINRLENRLAALDAKIDSVRTDINQVVEDASNERYKYHVELISTIDEKLEDHQERLQSEVDGLTDAVTAERESNTQRFMTIDAKVEGLSIANSRIQFEVGRLTESAAE